MLTSLLILLAVAGLQARPLKDGSLRFQNGGWVIGAPQLVQDQYMDISAHSNHHSQDHEPSRHLPTNLNDAPPKQHTEIKIRSGKTQGEVAKDTLEVQKAVPLELRRQGTEPSRRFLMDLNTGMLKEHLSEMNRRVSGFYNNPYTYEFRQGTQNSQASLVDIRTGKRLPYLSELQRAAEPLGEFKQGTEYDEVTLIGLRKEMFKRNMETPNIGQDEAKVQTEMGVDTLKVQKAVPPELRRQGTEPSRRFLMDLNTGMLKEQLSEMNRRVSAFYNNPYTYEFRQGTQNSQASLVDIRTGKRLPYLSELQRAAEPLGEFRQGTEYDEVTLIGLRKEMFKRNMETPNIGQDEAKVQTELGVDTLKVQKAVPPELRRQGTEPSRRFLMDLNTGMLKEQLSEMNRRVSAFYNNPYTYEFRQGTQNSQASLVDIRTGKRLPYLSELQRAAEPLGEFRQGTEYDEATLIGLRKEMFKRNMETPNSDQDEVQTEMGVDTLKVQKAVPHELRRQGTEPSRRFLMDLNTGMLKEQLSEMNRRVSGFYNNPYTYEFRQGTQDSQASLVDIRTGKRLPHLSELQRAAEPLAEFRQGTEYDEVTLIGLRKEMFKRNMDTPNIGQDEGNGVTACKGEVIDGKCYHFNPNLQTFSEAEASCNQLSSSAHLASVTSSDLHTRLVKMVTSAKSDPILTWLGGIVKNGQFQWIDGSTWEYSDWMPGHPRLKLARSCVEMFRIDESWWTTVDCGLKRASICSYPINA